MKVDHRIFPSLAKGTKARNSFRLFLLLKVAGQPILPIKEARKIAMQYGFTYKSFDAAVKWLRANNLLSTHNGQAFLRGRKEVVTYTKKQSRQTTLRFYDVELSNLVSAAAFKAFVWVKVAERHIKTSNVRKHRRKSKAHGEASANSTPISNRALNSSCQVSLNRMAKTTGVAKSTASRAMKAAEGLGLVRISRRFFDVRSLAEYSPDQIRNIARRFNDSQGNDVYKRLGLKKKQTKPGTFVTVAAGSNRYGYQAANSYKVL